ncbi:MAG: hemin ABC transporter substrate-binding protein [Acidimicrobiia bacterium]
MSLLGSNTETVYALGLGANVVGVDVTSQYPPEVSSKPQLGNFSTIAPEPVLAAKPTVVIAPAIPAAMNALASVRSGGIPVVFVPETTDYVTGENRVRLIADALGVPAAGDKLIATLRSQTDTAKKRLAPEVAKLRIIYLTYRNNQLSVFGQGSAPYVLVSQVGAINVVDELNIKTGPITAESLIAANPDVILFPTDVSTTLGGPKAFAALPAVAATAAATSGQVYPVDATKAQSLGPRTGEALAEIVDAIAKAKVVH